MSMAHVKATRGSSLAWAGGLSLTMAAAVWLAGFPARQAAPIPLDLQSFRPAPAPAVEAARLGLILEDASISGNFQTLVREVAPGGLAAEAGVRPGDLLVAIQDQLTGNARETAALLDTLPLEGPLQIEVLRSGAYLVLAAQP